MKLLSHFRKYVSSPYPILTNFPHLTIDAQYKIQYNFDISTTFHRTVNHLHDTSSDNQKKEKLPTLIILHGTGGGIDAARWHGLGLSQYSCHSQDQRPYQILSISRPGYLSSQPTCNSFSQEAYILDQMCQHLNLEQVAIMAVSGSGPTALTFVRDYPKRANGEYQKKIISFYVSYSGLILMDAISKRPSFNLFKAWITSNIIGRNITSNLISYLWHENWRPEQLVRFGFSGWDTVQEIRSDKSVDHLFREHFLRTFTWGGSRRLGLRSETRRLKYDLNEQPNWTVHVPVLYLYGGKDQLVTDEHVQHVMNNVVHGVPKQVARFSESTHVLPLKQSSILVNEFLSKYVFL